MTDDDAPALVPSDHTHPTQRARQFQLVHDLEKQGVFTPVALDLSGVTLSYDRADALARFLGTVRRRSSWYIGDLLLYAEDAFGEKYAQIEAATGLSEHTLENLASVSRRVPPSRRVDGLGWSLHEAVAKLDAEAQAYWLQRALAGGWSRAVLREHMAHRNQLERGDTDGDAESPPTVVEVLARVLRVGRRTDDGHFVLVPRKDWDMLVEAAAQ